MQLAAITSILSIAALASATATVTRCDVQHNADAPGSAFRVGNRFTVHIDHVPDVSESTICGHSDKQIHNSANAFSTRVNSNVDCHTGRFGGNQNTMDLLVRFDKQSPGVQRNALHSGLINAFGNQGLQFDINICNINGIPN